MGNDIVKCASKKLHNNISLTQVVYACNRLSISELVSCWIPFDACLYYEFFEAKLVFNLFFVGLFCSEITYENLWPEKAILIMYLCMILLNCGRRIFHLTGCICLSKSQFIFAVTFLENIKSKSFIFLLPNFSFTK